MGNANIPITPGMRMLAAVHGIDATKDRLISCWNCAHQPRPSAARTPYCPFHKHDIDPNNGNYATQRCKDWFPGPRREV